MYVLSWIFLAAAIGSLAYGLSQPGLTFIYISIGASVVALLFLLAGVLRKKPVQPATAGAPYGPPPEEAAARSRDTAATTAVTARPGGRGPSRAPETPPQRKPAAATRPETPKEPTPAAAEAAEAAEEEAPKPTAKKPTAKKTAAKKTASRKKAAAEKPSAKKPAAKKSAAGGRGAQVVAIPERGTYHEAGCRFVKGRRDTEKLGKTTAKRRGYSACGVCKPDQAA